MQRRWHWTGMMMMMMTYHIVFYIAECHPIKLRVIQVRALKLFSPVQFYLCYKVACTCIHMSAWVCVYKYAYCALYTVHTPWESNDAMIVVYASSRKKNTKQISEMLRIHENSIRITTEQIVWYIYVYMFFKWCRWIFFYRKLYCKHLFSPQPVISSNDNSVLHL